MAKPLTVLREPESQPESRLPAHVKRLPRPQPLGRAVELAFLRWEKRQLAPTERFWRDPRERSAPPVADFAGSGTGLGLAIATGLVASAHGELRIANHAPTGAIVTIVLPAQTETAGTSSDAPAAPQPTN